MSVLAPRRSLAPRSSAWAGYAAFVWAVTYAIGVRGYHGLGGAQRDERAQFLWDLLFYEPWFLGLGVLVTLSTLHHHARTGGSIEARRRLLILTALATLVLTALACSAVVARSV